MNGIIRIEFQIVDGKLSFMLYGPMKNLQEKCMTAEILARAIPIALNYEEPAIIQTPANGKLIVPPAAPAPKSH